jgi:putative transcriptional regulator
MFTSTRGQLLVSQPTLRDPNFNRTVIYVIEHTEEGALGVVLNRPSEIGVGDLLPAWEKVVSPPGVLFGGGPVGRDSLIGLVVDGGIIDTIDLAPGPTDDATSRQGLRVFNGYSGWGAGQLDAELEVGGWFVIDADPTDVLARDPDRLLRTVLRRQGGRLAMLAVCPPDLALN